MITGTCWRCEEPGHVAAECKRPAPKTAKELEARIKRHVERWQDGDISLDQKRKFIGLETASWKKPKAA